MVQRKSMGQILLERGWVNEEQLESSLAEQSQTGEKLGKILVKKGILSEQQLLEILEYILGIPQVQLSQISIDPETVKLLSPQMIRFHRILPITLDKGILTLAMADPLNYQAIDDVRMATNLNVTPVLASEKEIDTIIRQFLAFRLDPGIERILGELRLENRTSHLRPKENVVPRIEEDAPIIRIVNSLLIQAVQGHCSDIHIEPQKTGLRIRFRVDGELYEVLTLAQSHQAAVVSRVKITANLDIAEKRIPQDGRFRMDIEGREVDFRVSTLPTVYGEKVVVRILDQANGLTRIEQLGLSGANKEKILSLARCPHGMVLVTGPTGSGKTTTLYALLGEINSVDKNIITLEDPVEYSLAGINQVQANPKAGLTFASGLRSVLRQDPDVIMVGEVRDHDTAQLAVQAALTGHLVLSTLHTNSAVGTIARLIDMGMEHYLLASSLAGVVSQRLVRRLCSNCRQEYTLEPDIAQRLGIPEEGGQTFYRAVGCIMCRQLGYSGRIALHEVMVLGARVRDLISRGKNLEGVIEQAAINEGLITIKRDGIYKAKQGLTSLEEVIKAVLLGG